MIAPGKDPSAAISYNGAHMRRWIPWVERIARLKAWGRPLDEVAVRLKERTTERSSGTAWPVERRIVVSIGTNPAFAISTIVHEFAHCAAPGDAHHGPAFKARFRDATIELTGRDPGMLDNYRVFGEAARDVYRAWWDATHAKTWDAAEKFARLAGGGS